MRRVCYLLAVGVWLVHGVSGRAEEPNAGQEKVTPVVHHQPGGCGAGGCGAHHGYAPGCGHGGAGECQRGCSLRQICRWLTYRPLPTHLGGHGCKHRCNPVCQPPPYAYFLNLYGPGSCPGAPLHGGPHAPPLPPPVHAH